jgi:hypothetical protein
MQKWILYDWLLGLSPAILVPFAFWLVRRSSRTVEIIGDGQLFFFCTALAGAAFGALTEASNKLSEAQKEEVKLCYGVIVFVILFASFAFGAATQADQGAKPRIAKASLWLSVGTSILVASIRSYFKIW